MTSGQARRHGGAIAAGAILAALTLGAPSLALAEESATAPDANVQVQQDTQVGLVATTTDPSTKVVTTTSSQADGSSSGLDATVTQTASDGTSSDAADANATTGESGQGSGSATDSAGTESAPSGETDATGASGETTGATGASDAKASGDARTDAAITEGDGTQQVSQATKDASAQVTANEPAARPAATTAAARAAAATGVNMYRFYNPNTGEHFYTSNVTEGVKIANAGWSYEGIGWVAPTSGIAVYRLYNPNAGDHHYTTNAAEKNMLVSLGWRYEGIGWYGASGSNVGSALLRQYNPNAKGAGAHNFTTSKAESNSLVSQGWRYEGTAWYASTLSAKSIDTSVFIPSRARIEKYVSWAVDVAEDETHGYSQSNRWGPDYDCSSLVISALKQAGINTGSATYTGNMRENLVKYGKFTALAVGDAISTTRYSELVRGDILLNTWNHVAIYLGNGLMVAAHLSETGGVTGKAGDQTGREISVSSYSNYPWDWVLRLL
jgi:cell wall-associated NlpC family hydrolase